MLEFNNTYDYHEMSRLYLLLCDADIPCEVRFCHDGLQLCYPSIKNCVCDAILHSGSYGHEKGLLEIMGLCEVDDDDVEGYLSAADVFLRIKQHYYGE